MMISYVQLKEGPELIKLIAQSEYLKMPWKNKKGTTSQIVIEPQKSSLQEMNFNFRLSSAPINEDAAFSKFPGYNRILIPIRGRGFNLNGTDYELHEVAYFSGSEETYCELVDGEVTDLGLIYNPDVYKANVKILKFKNNFTLNKEANSVYLISILQGAVKINDVLGADKDTFIITEVESLNFSSAKNSVIALFDLKAL